MDVLFLCELLVPRAGIEPARRQAPTDFKSVASTSSATPAQVEKCKPSPQRLQVTL